MHANKRREILLSGDEGRNPHEVTLEEYREVGFEPLSSTKAIRQECMDCNSTFNEVRLCPAVDCPLWPWRMGTRPKAWKGLQTFRKREGSATPAHDSPDEGGGQG
jgi:hypothetical protein